VMAAVVTETDMLTALEVSLLNEQPIGQVMLSLGFISEDILAAGLTLQATLGHESLSLGEAVGALERIHSDHLTLIQAVCEAYSLEAGEIDDAALLALLVESGLVEPAAAERTLAVSLHVRQSFVDLLIRNELIDEELLCEAIKCQLLLKENLIPQAIAVPALRHCQWTGIDLATIIHQLETDEPGEEACEPHISEQSARRPGSPGGDGQFAPMIDADVMTLQHSWH
ncbi:MAG TPA: hypothetical protein V6C72_00760, partial [Chroococcales cyanobacterium]